MFRALTLSLALTLALPVSARLPDAPDAANPKAAVTAAFSREQVNLMIEQGLLNRNFVIDVSEAELQRHLKSSSAMKSADGGLGLAVVVCGAVLCYLKLRSMNGDRRDDRL